MRPEKKVPTPGISRLEILPTLRHKLRTPLNSIIGFSDLLKQRIAGELNAKQERYVDNILANSKLLLNIINDIIDLLQLETEVMELLIEQFSIPSAIDEVTGLIAEKAEKRNVIIKKELDPELSNIEADQSKIKQVLFNLLDNAVKFSKEDGGTVTISTKKSNDTAQFQVSDTGIGIREKDMEKIFKAFEQLDDASRKSSGTGLKLLISKHLVEMHGGEITVKSRVGEGSTFTFSLPILQKKGIK